MKQNTRPNFLEKARLHNRENMQRYIYLLEKRLWFWLFLQLWSDFWTIVLALTIRKQNCGKSLFDLEEYWIRHVVDLPRIVGRLLVETKLPDGVVVIERDISSLLVDEIYNRRIYEKHYNIQKEDVVIDVGAHVGTFTLKASKQALNGRVVSVEPNPKNYNLLAENIRRNKLKNVIALKAALSDYDGIARLYTNDSMIQSSAEHSIVKKVSNNYVEVPVKKLDTIVKELKLNKVSMIKIDVEGAELGVLRGALKTIKMNDLHLAIATYHSPTETREVLTYLKTIGLKTVLSEDKDYVYAHTAAK